MHAAAGRWWRMGELSEYLKFGARAMCRQRNGANVSPKSCDMASYTSHTPYPLSLSSLRRHRMIARHAPQFSRYKLTGRPSLRKRVIPVRVGVAAP